MNLPQQFIESLGDVLPANEIREFLSALEQTPPVSIRLHPRKSGFDLPSAGSVPWADDGFYLAERPIFTLDPLLHAGAYYVQEASSMFIGSLLEGIFGEQRDIVALDLCAAPGGKSTDILSFLDGRGLLVANETIRPRANILKENIMKWGYGNVAVTSSDPSAFTGSGGIFDLVLIDAPCSGEGMFRKDQESTAEWSPRNVEICADRQRRILSDAWECLKPGGVLVYSTCTYNRKENEDNIAWMTGGYDIENVVPLSPLTEGTGIVIGESAGIRTYRFFPHKVKGEGLFVAAMRKKEDTSSFSEEKKKRKEQAKTGNKIPPGMSDLINAPGYELSEKDGSVNAVPARYSNLIRKLGQYLRVIHAGIEVAEMKGRDLVPAHGLALSLHLDKDHFGILDVDRQDALRFLKKEEIKAEGKAPGWLLVLYRGFPLGWIKSIGSRANNYYPKEWRIRMDINGT